MLSNKEIIDRVEARLMDGTGRARAVLQGAPGFEPRLRCAYSTPGGNRCAAGIFLPDDHPCLTFSGDWDMATAKWPELFDIGDPGLISRLQTLHDEAGHWTFEDDKLNPIGREYLADIRHDFLDAEVTP